MGPTTEQEAGRPVFEMLQQMPDGPLRDMVERALQVYLRRIERGDTDGPGNTNEIVQFIHCGQCLAELKAAGMPESPQDYSRLSIGFTPRGMQVWCHRHDANVCHVDYEGVQHPANQTSPKPPKSKPSRARLKLAPG